MKNIFISLLTALFISGCATGSKLPVNKRETVYISNGISQPTILHVTGGSPRMRR